MIDVLVLTFFDFSNTGWRFSKMIESLGFKVKMFKGRGHEFNYPIEAEVFEPLAKLKPIFVRERPFVVYCPELAPWVEEAKIIHFTSSTFVSTGVDLTNKKVVVNHGGTTYRNGANLVNALFNGFTDATIIQCPDLLGLGAKNEHLIYYPVQTDWLQPDYEKREKIVFGHFPSSPASKGTSMIIKVFRKLSEDPWARDKFEYIGVTNAVKGGISWLENLDRIRKCDVIVETVCPVLRGRKFGEWGNQCLEASALGKIVITNTLSKELYKREYGDFAPHIANDEVELEARIREILEMGDLTEEKKKHREWAVQNHSMEVTAERLWDKVYGFL